MIINPGQVPSEKGTRQCCLRLAWGKRGDIKYIIC